MIVEAVGVFHCAAKYPYDAARQPGHAHASAGHVLLHPGQGYEQALQDLEGFSRIWLLYQFHHNAHWKPQVAPPRADRKVGVFATRAPYRPNAIGLSCVELLRVEGLRIEVGAHDLLDGTPILDIKPYLPYADSFPGASCGWLDALDARAWEITLCEAARAQLDWIEERSDGNLRAFLMQQLSERPFDAKRKRIRALAPGAWEIAYRTWRARYHADEAALHITIERIYSGYSIEDLAMTEDKYNDKAVHRHFLTDFGQA